MDWGTPTNHEELMNILHEIFLFYRVKKQEFYPDELKKIDLEKLPLKKKSDEELLSEATELLSGEHSREIFERKEKLNENIEKTKEELCSVEEKYEQAEKEAKEKCASEVEEYKITAARNGIINTDAYSERISELYAGLSSSISELTAQKEQRTKELNSELARLEEQASCAEEYYSALHRSEIQAKFAELKEKEEERIREIVKYNNGVEEKNVKYSNYVDQAKASQLLRYMEIRSEPLSKDELINIGYYPDVINVLKSYYDTIGAAEAYKDISKDSAMTMYLEDYHEMLLAHYKTVASS